MIRNVKDDKIKTSFLINFTSFQHVTIREKYDLDHVLDWTPPEVLRLYQPGRFFGEDTDGNPVFYDVSGGIDMKGIFDCCEKVVHSKLSQW